MPLLGSLPAGSLDSARATALQAVLDASVAGGAPDVIAAVITADGAWSGAAGIGGPDGRKATASDEFAIASVTKMFTASLILRLAEAGRIDLEAPLSSYMGDLKTDANGATVRQALGMMGGFAEDAPDAVDAIHADVRHDWTATELVRAFGPPVAKPGTTYLYSNPGYALLAIAAEHVTGKSFAEALRSEVLNPVDAARILEQGSDVATPKPWALPTLDHAGIYKQTELGAGSALPCLSSATYSIGGSSMASDAPSLAAWTWRLFNGEVVDKASLEAMTTIGNSGYGLGMELLTGITPTAYGHTGSKTGYGSIVAMFPAEHAVVVVFANDPDYIVEPTVLQLLAAARTP